MASALTFRNLQLALTGAGIALVVSGANALAGDASSQRATPAPANTERMSTPGSGVGHCANDSAAPSAPFSFSIDGEAVDKRAVRSRANGQRCTDVALSRADIQVRYDGMNTEPRLNVVAVPDVAPVGREVVFRSYTNYALQISHAEIRIFEKNVTPRQSPAVVLPLRSQDVQWRIPPGLRDQLTYVLRVYDGAGRFDETRPKLIEITKAVTDTVRPRKLLSAYDGNSLLVRNISVTGGAILVSGHGVPSGHDIRVMGLPVPIDSKGDFAFRQIVPSGPHEIEVVVSDDRGVVSAFSRSATIPDHDFFYVALADLTVGRGSASGPIDLVKPEASDDYKNKYFASGRLAFYLKGKIRGDTLLTASADTRDQPIRHLFTGFDSKDPRYLLRNLEPDRYYPVYGDDSTLVEDAPTRGKFYVRLERGDSSIVWGNFRTTITGTEFVRYNRGLYGARAASQTQETTSFGERRGKIETFVASPGTLGARDVFRGTGGSLYYLRRQNVTVGSEHVSIEVRDANTGLVIATRTLTATQDYEVNYLQGRITLRSPLSSTGNDDFAVRAGSLSGAAQYMVVNYEYAPGFQENKDRVVGGRASYWINEHVQVGVTGYDQDTVGERLTMGGADVTVRLSKGSYINLEAARSNGPGSGESVSIDGGYSFNSRNSSGRAANARKVEVGADLEELLPGTKGRVAAYWKEKGRDYSGPGEITIGRPSREAGVRSDVTFDEYWSAKTKFSHRQDEFRRYSVGEQAVTYTFNRYWKTTYGVRVDNNEVDLASASPGLNKNGRRTDVGMRVDYTSQDDWGAYAFGQVTAERTGERSRNNRVGVGGNIRLTERTKASGEISYGDGGVGAKAGLEYKIDESRTSYLNYALDPDRTDYISREAAGILTTGVRHRFNDHVSVFGEERLRHGGGYSGLTHAYGLDFVPYEHAKAGIIVETGGIRDPYAGDLERTALSGTLGYSHNGAVFSSKLEYRHDDLTTTVNRSVRETYLMANSLGLKIDPDWRFIAKLNGSYSTSTLGSFYSGKYLEGITGFAYRPVHNDRLNALFKYTFFYSLPSPGQIVQRSASNEYAQKNQVLSVDAAYDLNKWITVGAKYAFRFGEIRDNTISNSAWFDSQATLAIGRIDLHVIDKWDLTAELRSLDVATAKDRQTGGLIAVYRHLGDNFKVGVGYNFTNYSDDLTNLSTKNRGIFVNAIGKF